MLNAFLPFSQIVKCYICFSALPTASIAQEPGPVSTNTFACPLVLLTAHVSLWASTCVFLVTAVCSFHCGEWAVPLLRAGGYTKRQEAWGTRAALDSHLCHLHKHQLCQHQGARLTAGECVVAAPEFHYNDNWEFWDWSRITHRKYYKTMPKSVLEQSPERTTLTTMNIMVFLDELLPITGLGVA